MKNTQSQSTDVINANSFFNNTNLRSPRLFQDVPSITRFLDYVVLSKYYNSDKLLRPLAKDKAQELLLSKGTCTDPSGKIFHCSAYEYAYWAMDTRMCRMLEKYMDASTKAELFQRCQLIDRLGLDFQQQGQSKKSTHFDLSPLKSALKSYADGLDQWVREGRWDKIQEAWLMIGKAQRALPAHIVLEYCRRNGRFDPIPTFNETDLPANRTYEQENSHKEVTWFYQSAFQNEGLGSSFSIYKGSRYGLPLSCSKGGQVSSRAIKGDYAAIQKLDKVRREDRQQSLENLLLDIGVRPK